MKPLSREPIRVTDHAVIRYLERALGLNVEVVREHIAGICGTMAAWGADYKSHMIWRKVTKNGKVRWGTGYRTMSGHEVILLGAFGKSQIHDRFPSIFDGIAREHSRKPQEFFDLVIDKTPGLDRCSLFTRETRDGFSGWGDEPTKFDAAA